MRILVLTDIHGKKPDKLLGIKNIDMLIVLGDVTTGGNLKETQNILNPLLEGYKELYVIPGNWDKPESQEWFREQNISLDSRTVEKTEVLFYGLGGSPPTPFNTPNEFKEDELAKRLTNYPFKENHGKKVILCTHSPPYGACDRTATGLRVGSPVLRNFIKDYSPDLTLCGHIHEARGKEFIDTVAVINPGQAPNHYAIVEIGKEISVELH